MSCMSGKERKILWAILMEIKKRVKILEGIALPYAGDVGKRPTGAIEQDKVDRK